MGPHMGRQVAIADNGPDVSAAIVEVAAFGNEPLGLETSLKLGSVEFLVGEGI
jgi:hypothetical protein